MKNCITLLILFAGCSLLSNKLFSQTPDTWTQKNAIGFNQPTAPSARHGAVCFSIDSKGYIGTGYDGVYKKDFWSFDPTANTWTQITDFPGSPRFLATAFVIGSKAYVGTGSDENDNTTKDFYEYDPSSNSWIQKSNFAGPSRSAASCFSIGQKGYLGTGTSGTGGTYLKDLWEYDATTDSWTQKADVHSKRIMAVGFTINGKGYFCTGCLANGQSNDILEYDPLLDTWTKRAPFPGTFLCGAKGFAIGNKGYVGISNINFWEFNPASNTWVQKANYGGEARTNAISLNIGGKGYAGLGYTFSGHYKNDFWEYDPAVNVWNEKAKFGALGRYSASGFSIGNKGYIATGNSSEGLLNDLWEYDQLTGVWMQKANLPGPARQSAVGFSIGSKGYIGTGHDNLVFFMNDFWEYDPQSNTWTQKANFGGTPRNSAAGFSIGNKGYIGTGYDDNDHLKDFWEYDPQTDTWTKKANFGGSIRSSAISFSIGNKGYLGLGSPSNKKDFWEYDPQINAWTKKADFQPVYAVGSTAFSIAEKGYFTISDEQAPYHTDLYQYDPVTNEWSQKSGIIGTDFSSSVGFTINNKGYIATGRGETTYSKQLWEYTPDLLTTGVIAGNLFCPLSMIDVPFSTVSTFNAGNIFTAQLSDGNGSFATPQNIGTLSSITDGTIETIIPPSTPAGIGYRIRVVSSNPVMIGTDNGADLSIQANFTFYQDADGDGYGNSSLEIMACTSPANYVSDSTDCDDSNAAVYPGASEVVNGIDDDCNNEVDESLCLVPTGLYTSAITAKSALLHWTSDPVNKFKIKYRRIDEQGAWSGITVTGSVTSVNAINLQPEKTYEWKIKAVCDKPFKSPWSSTVLFTTLPLRITEELWLTPTVVPELILYPNPASNEFNASLYLEESINSEGLLEISNLLGKIVFVKNIMIENGAWSDRISMPHSTPAGIFGIRVMVNGESYSSKLVWE